MAIVRSQSQLKPFDGAVPLARYAQIITADECAFFGVRRFDDSRRQALCGYLWTKDERDMICRYLMEAQDEVEDELKYLLHPQWVTGLVTQHPNQEDRLTDLQEFYPRLNTRWGRLLEPGVRAESEIASGVPVVNETDPPDPVIRDPALVTFSPIPAEITDVNEIHIFHPGTDSEINPQSATLEAGVYTALIPRCRLVTEEASASQPRDGVSYNNPDAFETEVDLKRIYNDPSVNAELVYKHTCSNACITNGCNIKIETACITIKNPKIGLIDIARADYDEENGRWNPRVTGCNYGDLIAVRLNYYSGTPVTSLKAEDAIIRLAHSKMPEEPCGCEKLKLLWRRDREIPPVLTKERINCPFGLANGAWIAWLFTQTMRLVRFRGW